MLERTAGALAREHDLVMFDLDGVVQVGSSPVPGAAEHVNALRREGVRVGFVTNNAGRPPEAVADRLRGFGLEAAATDVVTSAQAAARLVRETFGQRARVLLLGGPGLAAALAEAGLETVEDGRDADVLVSGYGPEVTWSQIRDAAVHVARGLPYVASNTDSSMPTELGTAPGHGRLVRLIAEFAGVEPLVAGKPSPPLLTQTIERLGGRSPLMVGDRVDTDVEGARRVGAASLLVLTGVSGVAEVVAAMPEQRPSYISPDLAGLHTAHPVPDLAEPGRASLGGWTSEVVDGELLVRGDGAAPDWWRVVATAGWSWQDAHGRVVGTDALVPPVDGAVGASR